VKLIVTIPDSYSVERDYILSVILKEFLGLNYIIRRTGNADVCISEQDSKRCLVIPDGLFAIPKDKWLTKESLPKQPLEIWEPQAMGFGNSVGLAPVPVIYGACNRSADEENCFQNDQDSHLPIDIFGSAFFMLTRYEEIVKQDRDEHDRFPAWASLAYQEGFLERPIIDEYVEILWLAMKQLWPGLSRKKRNFEMVVSHDVDTPCRYGFLTIPQTIRAMGGDILLRGSIGTALLGPWIRYKTVEAIHRSDPYNTYDLIMDISERHGLVSAFYFKGGCTDRLYDTPYNLHHPAIRNLLRHIHERGHEIGLHPSYGAYQTPQIIVEEAAHLRHVCEEESIQQAEWGGRMHYLRWKTPTTLYGWEQAGMTYDSTLSYADHAGFRCGTCHEYPAFDPASGTCFNLRIRPLIAMEGTVIGKGYMGLGLAPSAYDKFLQLKQACRNVEGKFTLLWHHPGFADQQEREMYEAVVKG
jgi:hypothetical protein